MNIPAAKLNESIASTFSAMTSNNTTNSNQMDISQHPLEAIATGIQGALSGEVRAPRASHMMSANEGPADIIGKVSGVVKGGKRVDDGLYFTNNEGIPFPDP
jgi:catalase